MRTYCYLLPLKLARSLFLFSCYKSFLHLYLSLTSHSCSYCLLCSSSFFTWFPLHFVFVRQRHAAFQDIAILSFSSTASSSSLCVPARFFIDVSCFADIHLSFYSVSQRLFPFLLSSRLPPSLLLHSSSTVCISRNFQINSLSIGISYLSENFTIIQ